MTALVNLETTNYDMSISGLLILSLTTEFFCCKYESQLSCISEKGNSKMCPGNQYRETYLMQIVSFTVKQHSFRKEWCIIISV